MSFMGFPAGSPKPMGNSRVLACGPVAIGCMQAEARDLLDLAVEKYGRYRNRLKERPSTPNFIRWLFQKSGLIQGIDPKKAYEKYRHHVQEIREGNPNHPKAWIRNYRGSVYSFAYWFFRWSGMVEVMETRNPALHPRKARVQ